MSWSPAAYGHGTLPVEDDGQGDFFQDGDEGEEEEELEMFDESIDRFELSGWRHRRFCCDDMAGCCAGGWGCTFAQGEQELHPSLPGALRGRAGAADHGRAPEGREAKVAVGVKFCSRRSSLERQGVRRYSAEDGGGTQALAARWRGGFSAPGWELITQVMSSCESVSETVAACS